MREWFESHRGVVYIPPLLVIMAGLAFIVARWPRSPSPILASLTPAPSPSASPTPEPSPTPLPLRVYVSGAVQQPDVYTLPPNSIVKDAVVAAGGASSDADLDRINLALPLADGQQIYVPHAGEGESPLTRSSGAMIPSPSAAVAAKVNINTADVSELDRLPGIGPVKAQSIVEYRSLHGPFQKIEDIMAVPGIGEDTFEKIRELIAIN